MLFSNAEYVTSNLFVLLDQGFIAACLFGIEYSATKEIARRRSIKAISGLARAKMQELRRRQAIRK